MTNLLGPVELRHQLQKEIEVREGMELQIHELEKAIVKLNQRIANLEKLAGIEGE